MSVKRALAHAAGARVPGHVGVIKTVGSLRLRFPFRQMYNVYLTDIAHTYTQMLRVRRDFSGAPGDDSSSISRGSRAGAFSMSELARARGDSASDRLSDVLLFSSLLFSPRRRDVSSTCADDHVDRSFVVRPMTWRFMITSCITLSREKTSCDLRERIGLMLRLCLLDSRRICGCERICCLFYANEAIKWLSQINLQISIIPYSKIE